MKEKLLTIGNLWERYGKRRIYFSARYLAKLYGMRCEYYNTGNIYCAWVDDERISNTSARRLLQDFNGSFWYDLDSESFQSKGLSDSVVEKLTAGILAEVG